VTYMLDGRMQHKDHGGNTGDLGPGDVQWMTAARGIVHSEMPQQSEGRMRGFQLWLNLPAREKMKPASYCDIPSARIPVTQPAAGIEVRVIAGALGETQGPIRGLSTDPRFYDIRLAPRALFEAALPASHNAFLYAYEGEALVGEARDAMAQRAAGLLSGGDAVRVEAGDAGARLLLLAGMPIGEPIVQYGPFVMNTRQEIEQAVADYQSGSFAQAPVERIAVALNG
jgi:redox-sensitive bicupin YhaK (pirin superfamily)